MQSRCKHSSFVNSVQKGPRRSDVSIQMKAMIHLLYRLQKLTHNQNNTLGLNIGERLRKIIYTLLRINELVPQLSVEIMRSNIRIFELVLQESYRRIGFAISPCNQKSSSIYPLRYEKDVPLRPAFGVRQNPRRKQGNHVSFLNITAHGRRSGSRLHTLRHIAGATRVWLYRCLSPSKRRNKAMGRNCSGL